MVGIEIGPHTTKQNKHVLPYNKTSDICEKNFNMFEFGSFYLIHHEFTEQRVDFFFTMLLVQMVD